MRSHSIFLAKGFGESHGYAVNEAPLSYDDLMQVYERLLSGSQSSELIDWKKGDARERRFLNYQQENLEKYGFEERVQTAAADDHDTLVPTGTIYKLP